MSVNYGQTVSSRKIYITLLREVGGREENKNGHTSASSFTIPTYSEGICDRDSILETIVKHYWGFGVSSMLNDSPWDGTGRLYRAW